jgi:hypothetical protein
MLSILATFFTCLQQRELVVIRSAPALRAWLSNGVRYTNADGELVFQSSLAALTLLESPYEYLSIAITNFVAGIAAYLGSAYFGGVRLHGERGIWPELAVLVHFAAGTGFAFLVFPVLLGTKDKENRVARETLDGLHKAAITVNRSGQSPKSIERTWARASQPEISEEDTKR